MFGKDCFIAHNATVLGDVTLAEGCSVLFGAVVRADGGAVKVGKYSNIQDNVSVHCDPGHPVILGDYVSVGHNAVVHGCTVGDCTIVGLHATILNGAVVGRGCIIGAGAVVREGQVIPDHSLVVGVPAKVIKSGVKELEQRGKMNAMAYVELGRKYRNGEVKQHRLPLKSKL